MDCSVVKRETAHFLQCMGVADTQKYGKECNHLGETQSGSATPYRKEPGEVVQASYSDGGWMRHSVNVLPTGGPGADQGHAGEIICLDWRGNTQVPPHMG